MNGLKAATFTTSKVDKHMRFIVEGTDTIKTNRQDKDILHDEYKWYHLLRKEDDCRRLEDRQLGSIHFGHVNDQINATIRITPLIVIP